ncbi:MAG TPA: DNA primase small subunit PriS [Thermoplasmata archaeon]|nr:DNA primase small subunit PriS [Thermoplasmata archaeon]
MAKTVPLDAATLAWVRQQFAEYYGRATIDPPSRLARREFAAFPFATETMMRRHAALRSPDELRDYLAREVPRHVYYSSAYYRRPADPSMAAKEWLGADLIFDLDSDHLRGAERLDYAGQLSLVKERLLALVEDFLFRDFEIDPATTSIVFSGGRGYHVHIRDERFLPLSSPERRELVDYVLGTGVDPGAAVERRRSDVRGGHTLAPADEEESGRERGRAGPRTARLAPPDAPGWRGRTTRAVLAVLARWQEQGAKAAADEMTAAGIAPGKARRWAKVLVDHGGAEKVRASFTIDVFGKDSPDEFLSAMVPRAAIEVQGETDAPVTTDIHRLIRLPNSLHGGTGLRVVPLGRDDVRGFDPFRDALVPTADGRRTAVTYTAELSYPFPDGGVRGHPGATDELPTPVATFLVLRGEAALRPSPG